MKKSLFSFKKKHTEQSDQKDQTLGLILLATILGGLICGYFVFQADFPLNDGGMFYSMVKDLEGNHFLLPAFTSYNHSLIPYAYPPLAFYLIAILHSFFKINLITLFRFFPLTFSIFSIPAFYLLCTQLLKRKDWQVVATFLYAVLPASYTWQIMGGGVTRSLAWLLSIFGLFYFLRYTKSRKASDLIWFTLFTTLTTLTHLEMVWFLALSYLTVYLFFDRTWRGFRDLVIAALSTLLLTCPWWIAILRIHGWQTFAAAFSTGGFTLSSPIAFILSMGGADKMSLSFISFLAVLGVFILAREKNWFVFIWLLVLIFLDPRSSQRIAVLPIAMLASVSLVTFFIWLARNPNEINRQNGAEILLQKPVSVVFLVFLIYALFMNVYSLYSGGSYIQYLNKENRDAMVWVKENTPTESKFLVLDFPYGWFSDMAAEWFPALTERKSILTVQGLEWLPGQAAEVSKALSAIANCKMYGLNCLEDWASKDSIIYDYVYFSSNWRFSRLISGNLWLGFEFGTSGFGCWRFSFGFAITAYWFAPY